jgi:transcriptional regulator with XRE-family HTH domain
MQTFLIGPESAQAIERRLAQKRMTRRDLARAARVSERTIYKALLGAAELRGITVEALALALDMPVEMLTGVPPAPATVYPEAVSQAMVVRETPAAPVTMRQAIEAIAYQTGVSVAEAAAAVAGLMAKPKGDKV